MAAAEGYRGARLGLPESGRGALASLGRRVAALLIDWIAANLVSLAVTQGRYRYGSQALNLIALGIFALEVFALTWLAGGSFGQRIVRIGVVSLDPARPRVGFARALARTVLICLAIPPLIWDRDARGLHDRAVLTAVVNG